MRNEESWKPTKAELHKGRWRASRNSAEVALGSRAAADWMIGAYQCAIQSNARGVLADIGCGKMPYYGIYRHLVSEVLGIDWPASVHSNNHVDILCDLNDGIKLESNTIDTILCTDVLEHIFSPAQLWQEFSRLLKPGGKAIVATPFLYWIHESPYDFHRYTRFALERYAGDAGLQVNNVTAIGGFPHVLTDLLCKATARIGFVSEALRLMSLAALKVRRIERAAEFSASKFPLAYLIVSSKPITSGTS